MRHLVNQTIVVDRNIHHSVSQLEIFFEVSFSLIETKSPRTSSIFDNHFSDFFTMFWSFKELIYIESSFYKAHDVQYFL